MLCYFWGKDSDDKYDYNNDINQIQIMDIIIYLYYGHFIEKKNLSAASCNNCMSDNFFQITCCY